jgi:hypothetical protein
MRNLTAAITTTVRDRQYPVAGNGTPWHIRPLRSEGLNRREAW